MKLFLLGSLIGVFEFLAAQTAPTWQWAKSAGDSSHQQGNSIVTDVFGNIYAAGTFYGSITFDTLTLNANGFSDLFLAKYNSNGSMFWVRQLGGNNNEGIYFNPITTDMLGNIYFTGTFCSDSIVFDTITLYSSGPLCDMFVVKYDSSGNVVWAKGTANSTAYAITMDKTDNIIITGGTSSPNFTFDTVAIASPANGFYILKCDSAGHGIWARIVYGNNFDASLLIITDNYNNIYVTGWFDSDSIFFDSTVLYTAGGRDMFIAKYDSSGNLLWAKKAGEIDDEDAYDITIDPLDNIYVSGDFWSDSIVFDSFILYKSSAMPFSSDMFLVKYDTSGNVLWAKNTSGADNAWGISVCTGTLGDVYLAGYFIGDSIIFGSLMLSNVGEQDIFLVKYDGSGNVLWVKGAGGLNDDGAFGVAFDINTNIYVNGFFQSATINFGSTMLTNFDSSANSIDAFIAKLDATIGIIQHPNQISNIQISPNPFTDELRVISNQFPNKTGQVGDKAEIKIFDITGKEILHQKTSAAETKINTAHLAPGFYVVNYKEGDKSMNMKVVKM